MRSRAKSIGEWVLHALAIGLVAWALWGAIRPSRFQGPAMVTDRALPAALIRWTTGRDEPSAIDVRYSAVPAAVQRDWLAALARVGTDVTWGSVAGTMPATAVDVEPVVDPIGEINVAAAAPRGATVVLADALGVLDSAGAPRGIVAFRLAPTSGAATVGVGATVARAARPDALTFRRLYVVGEAGWETKFVVRALEDEGWVVDARIGVTPTRDVVPAKSIDLDTARYAAVVAVDSMIAGDRARVARFVESGGGLVVTPSAAAVLPSLAVGYSGPAVDGTATLVDSAPKRGLTLWPVVRMSAGASGVEWRDSAVTVAVRRVGRGQVVQVGYSDSWRWRMAPGDSAGAAYRAWWAGVVARVAVAPVTARVPESDADPAPMVAAVERLGPPTAFRVVGGGGERGEPWPAWVFAVIAVALVAEWGSRRWRGVP